MPIAGVETGRRRAGWLGVGPAIITIEEIARILIGLVDLVSQGWFRRPAGSLTTRSRKFSGGRFFLPAFACRLGPSRARAASTIVRRRRYLFLRVHGTPSTPKPWTNVSRFRSEEHTSELQSRFDIVCSLLLEK